LHSSNFQKMNWMKKCFIHPTASRSHPKETNVLSSVSGLIETDSKESAYQSEMLSHYMLVNLKRPTGRKMHRVYANLRRIVCIVLTHTQKSVGNIQNKMIAERLKGKTQERIMHCLFPKIQPRRNQ